MERKITVSLGPDDQELINDIIQRNPAVSTPEDALLWALRAEKWASSLNTWAAAAIPIAISLAPSIRDPFDEPGIRPDLSPRPMAPEHVILGNIIDRFTERTINIVMQDERPEEARMLYRTLREKLDKTRDTFGDLGLDKALGDGSSDRAGPA